MRRTKLTALQIAPGASVYLDRGQEALGAVTLRDQLFVVVRESEGEPDPCSPPTAPITEPDIPPPLSVAEIPPEAPATRQERHRGRRVSE